mgnify:FL=1
MSYCAIDFGHTNYKIAFIENDNIISFQKHSYNDRLIFDGMIAKIKSMGCDKILCCNVLNESIINSIVSDFPQDMKNILKFFSSEDCQKHITLAYNDNIKRLGADRALNLVGASTKTKNDLIVIDAGTATTIDYLDSSKNHIGGIILPGKNLIDNIFHEMLDFDFSEERLVADIFSKNTRSCIENGSLISAYYAINNILDKMIKSKDCVVEIYVTGGNAKDIIDNCNYPLIHVESLLFDGLVVLEA